MVKTRVRLIIMVISRMIPIINHQGIVIIIWNQYTYAVKIKITICS